MPAEITQKNLKYIIALIFTILLIVIGYLVFKKQLYDKIFGF